MKLLTPLSAGAEFVDFNDSGGQVIASYPNYGEAQHAIDRLADVPFPVQFSEIVGRDLRMVERVTGRMTDGRAAAAGAATGAWFGLLIGLLVGLFTFGPAWLGLILGGLLIGSLWGALFGFLIHRMGTDSTIPQLPRRSSSPPRPAPRRPTPARLRSPRAPDGAARATPTGHAPDTPRPRRRTPLSRRNQHLTDNRERVSAPFGLRVEASVFAGISSGRNRRDPDVPIPYPLFMRTDSPRNRLP
jgi:hypothetical protein